MNADVHFVREAFVPFREDNFAIHSVPPMFSSFGSSLPWVVQSRFLGTFPSLPWVRGGTIEVSRYLSIRL